MIYLASLADWLGEMNASQAAAIASLATVIIAFIGLLKSNKTHKEVQQVNHAVNNTSDKGIELSLVEMVHEAYKTRSEALEQLERIEGWQKKWASSPWQNGDDIDNWIRQNEERWREVKIILTDIIKKHRALSDEDDEDDNTTKPNT